MNFDPYSKDPLQQALQRLQTVEQDNLILRQHLEQLNSENFNLQATILTCQAEMKYEAEKEVMQLQSQLSFKERELQTLHADYVRATKELGGQKKAGSAKSTDSLPGLSPLGAATQSRPVSSQPMTSKASRSSYGSLGRSRLTDMYVIVEGLHKVLYHYLHFRDTAHSGATPTHSNPLSSPTLTPRSSPRHNIHTHATSAQPHPPLSLLSAEVMISTLQRVRAEVTTVPPGNHDQNQNHNHNSHAAPVPPDEVLSLLIELSSTCSACLVDGSGSATVSLLGGVIGLCMGVWKEIQGAGEDGVKVEGSGLITLLFLSHALLGECVTRLLPALLRGLPEEAALPPTQRNLFGEGDSTVTARPTLLSPSYRKSCMVIADNSRKEKQANGLHGVEKKAVEKVLREMMGYLASLRTAFLSPEILPSSSIQDLAEATLTHLLFPLVLAPAHSVVLGAGVAGGLLGDADVGGPGVLASMLCCPDVSLGVKTKVLVILHSIVSSSEKGPYMYVQSHYWSEAARPGVSPHTKASLPNTRASVPYPSFTHLLAGLLVRNGVGSERMDVEAVLCQLELVRVLHALLARGEEMTQVCIIGACPPSLLLDAIHNKHTQPSGRNDASGHDMDVEEDEVQASVGKRNKRRHVSIPDLEDDEEASNAHKPPSLLSSSSSAQPQSQGGGSSYSPGSVWSVLGGDGGIEVLGSLSFIPMLHIFQSWAYVYKHLDLIHTDMVSCTRLESLLVQLGVQLTILCNTMIRILRGHLQPSHESETATESPISHTPSSSAVEILEMNSSPRAKAHKLKPNGASTSVNGASPTSGGSKKKTKKAPVEFAVGEDAYEDEDIRNFNGYPNQLMSPNPAMIMNGGTGPFRSIDTLDKSLEGNTDEMIYQVQNLLSENAKLRMRLRQEMEEKYVLEHKVVTLTDKLIEAKRGLQDTSFALQKIQLVTSQLLNKKEEKDMQLQESVAANNILTRKLEELEKLCAEKQGLLEMQARFSREKRMQEKDGKDNAANASAAAAASKDPKKEERIAELEGEISALKDQISQLKRGNVRMIEEKADMQFMLDAKSSRITTLEERLKTAENKLLDALSSSTAGDGQLKDIDSYQLGQLGQRLAALERQTSTPLNGNRPPPNLRRSVSQMPGVGPPQQYPPQQVLMQQQQQQQQQPPLSYQQQQYPPQDAQQYPPSVDMQQYVQKPPRSSAGGSRRSSRAQQSPQQADSAPPMLHRSPSNSSSKLLAVAPSSYSSDEQQQPPYQQQQPPYQQQQYPAQYPPQQQQMQMQYPPQQQQVQYASPPPQQYQPQQQQQQYAPPPQQLAASPLPAISQSSSQPAPVLTEQRPDSSSNSNKQTALSVDSSASSAPSSAASPSSTPTMPFSALRSPSMRSSTKTKKASVSLPPVHEGLDHSGENELDPVQAALSTAAKLKLATPSDAAAPSPPNSSPSFSLSRNSSELFHQAVEMSKKGSESETDDDNLESGDVKKKLESEKKAAKKTIMEWYKKFVAENGREPTKMERDIYVGEIYKKYRRNSKVVKDLDVSKLQGGSTK